MRAHPLRFAPYGRLILCLCHRRGPYIYDGARPCLRVPIDNNIICFHDNISASTSLVPSRVIAIPCDSGVLGGRESPPLLAEICLQLRATLGCPLFRVAVAELNAAPSHAYAPLALVGQCFAGVAIGEGLRHLF
jgi:hypothetical protein